MQTPYMSILDYNTKTILSQDTSNSALLSRVSLSPLRLFLAHLWQSLWEIKEHRHLGRGVQAVRCSAAARDVLEYKGRSISKSFGSRRLAACLERKTREI